MGIYEQAKALAQRVRQRTQQSALAQTLRAPVRVSSPVARITNYFANTPSGLRTQALNNAPLQSFARAGLRAPTGIRQSPSVQGVKNFTSQYVKNRYVEPVRQIPQNFRTTFGRGATPLQRGAGALGLLGGVATFLPDPIQDVAMPAYDYAKGAMASYRKGGKALENIKAGTRAMSLETPTGLGEALTTNPKLAQLGNIAELPALLAYGGIKAKKGLWTKRVLENEKEIRTAVGLAKNYDKYTPALQMKIFDKVNEAIKKIDPKTQKELAKESANTSTWLQKSINFLESSYFTAKDPQMNIGFNVQAKKHLKTPKLSVEPTGGKDLIAQARNQGGIGDINDVKARLLNVFTFSESEKLAIRKAQTPEELAPYLRKLNDGSLAKFFNSGAGTVEHPNQPKPPSVEPVGGKPVAQGGLSDIVRPDQISEMGRVKTKEIDNVFKKIPDGTVSPDGYVVKRGDKLYPTEKATPEVLKNSRIELNPDGSYKESNFGVHRMSFTEDVALQSLSPSKVVGASTTVKPAGIQKASPQASTQAPAQAVLSPGQAASGVAPGGISKVSKVKQTESSPTNSSQPYFNTRRLAISDEGKAQVKAAIEQAKPAIEKVVGKKLSNKEVIERSKQTARLMTQAVGRDQTSQWEATLLNTRRKLAKLSESGTVDKEYLDTLVTIKSLGTDIARKLQSFGINAEPGDITSKQAILDAVLKVNKNVDEVLAATKGVDFNNLEQATSFYRKFIKPNAEEWVDLLRYNSMLSSPNTWINNFFSNLQGVAGVKPIEKSLTGAVDAVRSAITGKEREYLVGEGPAYLKGVATNVGKATRAFTDALTGKSLNANPDTRHISLTTKGSKGRIVERSLDWTGRILEGTDQFFQTLARAGEETADAYKASKGVKIKGTAIEKAKKTLFRSDLGDNNGSHVLDAIDTVANVVQRLKGSKNGIVRTIAKYSLPFVKTPTNILKQGVEYSPLGFTTAFGSTSKTEQVAKAIMGTAVGTATALLVGSDRLSWAEPTDAKKKDQARAAGIQPYSVKIGDKWVSYSKLHPAIAFNFALVASLRDAEETKKLDDTQIETVLTGLSKWVKFYADQSYVKNIGEFVKTAQGDLEGPSRVLANYTQQLVPYRALMGWVARLTDPYQRKVDPKGTVLEKQIQQMMTQIPGLSQKIPARVGADGKPVTNSNRALNAFLPTRTTTENPKQKQYYQSMQDTSRVNTQKKQANEAIDSGRLDKIKLDPERKNYLTAEHIRSEVEKIDKRDRAGREAKLKEYQALLTPEVKESLKKIAEYDRIGLAKTDRELLLYDAPSRAVKIKERFADIKDVKRKRELLMGYQRVGILTPEVADELRKLKGKQ